MAKKLAPKEGKKQTGLRLKQSCGFCGERFRSARQRTDHTNFCKEKKQVQPNRRRRVRRG